MLRARCVAAARRVAAGAPVRGLAKQAKPAAKVEAPAADSTPAVLVVKGCNILNDGQDPPILPDAEYPDWLWTM